MSQGTNTLKVLWGLIAAHTTLNLSIKVIDRLDLELGSHWPRIVELTKTYDPTAMLTNPNIAILLLVLLSTTLLILLRSADKGAWR